MTEDVQGMLSEVRDNLVARRQAIDSDIQTLSEEAASIDRELNAINAYHTAKNPPTAPARSRGPHAGTAQRRGRRNEILAALAQNPGGATRADISSYVGAVAEKEKMSVSNALTKLRQAGLVDRNEDNRWALTDAGKQSQPVGSAHPAQQQAAE